MIITINEWKKQFEKKSPNMLSPDKVKPGMKGENYYGMKGTVIKIVKAKDYEQLKKYDESGWMTQSEFDNIDLDINDPELYFVAVKDDDRDNVVYVYGYDGFVVYENSEDKQTNKKEEELYAVVITSSGDWENPEIHTAYANDEDSAIDKVLDAINMERDVIEGSTDYSITAMKIDTQDAIK